MSDFNILINQSCSLLDLISRALERPLTLLSSTIRLLGLLFLIFISLSDVELCECACSDYGSTCPLHRG
jgi:hypothetical protein